MFFLLKHRQVLLEIFSKNYRVRRNLIQSRLTQECGEDLSKQEVDKVLKVRGVCAAPSWAWGAGRRGAGGAGGAEGPPCCLPAPCWWREARAEATPRQTPAPPSDRICVVSQAAALTLPSDGPAES